MPARCTAAATAWPPSVAPWVMLKAPFQLLASGVRAVDTMTALLMECSWVGGISCRRPAAAAGGRSAPSRPAPRSRCARWCHGNAAGLPAWRGWEKTSGCCLDSAAKWRESVPPTISPGATRALGTTSRRVRSPAGSRVNPPLATCEGSKRPAQLAHLHRRVGHHAAHMGQHGCLGVAGLDAEVHRGLGHDRAARFPSRRPATMVAAVVVRNMALVLCPFPAAPAPAAGTATGWTAPRAARRHFGCDGVEHLAARCCGCPAWRHGVTVHLGATALPPACAMADWPGGWWHRRMPARRLRAQQHRHRTLLGQAHQRRRPGRPGMMPSVMSRPSSTTKSSFTPRSFSSRAMGSAPRSPPTSSSCTEATRYTCARGWKPLARSLSTRFQLGDEVALVVPGATAPDKAVLDGAGERLGLPELFCPRRDRHHVLVRHQRHAGRGGIAAGPGEEQAQAPHHLALERGVHLAGSAAARWACSCGELRRRSGSRPSGPTRCGRGWPQRQRFGHRAFVHGQRRQRRHLHLPRALAPGVGQQPRCQQQQRGQQGPGPGA